MVFIRPRIRPQDDASPPNWKNWKDSDRDKIRGSKEICIQMLIISFLYIFERTIKVQVFSFIFFCLGWETVMQLRGFVEQSFNQELSLLF